LRRLTAALLTAAAVGAGCLCAGSASAAPAGTTHYPDLQTIIPLNSFSVVQGGEGPEFRYTHLVYNNGPGPLEIQPQYNPVSGTYQGMQRLFTHNAAGVWSLVSEVRVPDAFEFHAAHGHFHFPLAAFGLYQVNGEGGIGAPVSISPKNGFCIDDSYIYNTSVEHSGTFIGQRGTCADPTNLRGISVGGADEYDYRDPGQSIPFSGVPDGTYWFRAMTDPHNDLVEADESNNETDVLVTISKGKVTTGTVLHPDTTPPPVTMTSPPGGSFVGGPVPLTATSPVSGLSQVEFIVDGVPIGMSTDTTSPYHLTWDSSTVPDGEHWLAARATDAQGRINTSAVVPLNVTNAGPPPEPGGFEIDASASADGRGTLTQPIQVNYSHDLFLCLLSSDGPSGGGQTATVSGGGLSWSLVRRANARLGTSEIWKAEGPASPGSSAVTSTPSSGGYDQSLTVLAFAGAGGVGASAAASAASGAPSTSLTTTRDGSWVVGVGNDWDHATPRTVGPGQVLRHQWVDTQSGDTFWAQSQTGPTPKSGSLVSINDTAPTNDQWNLAAAEVLPSSNSPPPPQDTTPPQVSVTDPDPGETVSGIIALGAVAADNVAVSSVQFKIDENPLGAAVTSPPFMTQWDTRTFSAGQHTITAEAIDTSGNVAVSADVNVNVDNSAPPPANIEIDTMQFRHATGTLTTPAINTHAQGDVLVAYVGLDGPKTTGTQTATVSGAGLTWTPVKRSNTQAGDAEIWSAKASGQLSNATVTATPTKGGYAGSLTVIAYRNAAAVGIAGASGAPSGAPDIYLPGTGMGSWVFAVGNDWDRAVARTPVAGQVLQDQWLASSAGDTFWVQSTAAPNTAPGLVTIHDNAPTNDRWNYAAVEIVPAVVGNPSQPGTPSLNSTVPASPANQNSPKVLGNAEPGSTVRIYTSADCSGTPLATAAASALEAGIEVSVPDDSTSAFRATATTVNGTSTCSSPLTYVEDSKAPQTSIGGHPPALSEGATASFEFSGEDPGGSGVAGFQCRLDSTEAAAWTACASPKAYSSLANGAHRFEVKALDRAGNSDQSPALFEWQISVPTPPPSKLAIDKLVTTHQGSGGATISAPSLTTSQPGELLLAFIGSDGPQSGAQSITAVSGGGLGWTLRKRANTQAGTAEVWQAVAPLALSNTVVTATRAKGSYQGSITVAAFIGADTSANGAVSSGSAASGPPTASLVTTRAGGWVWGVGDDWDSAVARVVGPGQTSVDQYLSPSGDTFWVQRRTEPTAAAGTNVVVNDTSPTGDQWNFALIEVPPASGP
jgi:hypothetical protein